MPGPEYGELVNMLGLPIQLPSGHLPLRSPCLVGKPGP